MVKFWVKTKTDPCRKHFENNIGKYPIMHTTLRTLVAFKRVIRYNLEYERLT